MSARDDTIAEWTADLTARVSAQFGDQDIAAAALWLSQWRKDAAMDAFRWSPYPIADRTNAVLLAYSAALRAEAAALEADDQARAA